jgi:hypothetical protein
MDAASGAATLKTAIAAGQLGYQAWGWFKKWRYGRVVIDHPKNRDRQTKRQIDLSGSHSGVKRGHFWLLTVDGVRHWPKTEVSFKPDGRWGHQIDVGGKAGPRECVVVLAWVSDYTHALLSDIMQRSRKGNIWEPVLMKPDKGQFSVVQAIVLNVELPPD